MSQPNFVPKHQTMLFGPEIRYRIVLSFMVVKKQQILLLKMTLGSSATIVSAKWLIDDGISYKELVYLGFYH